MKMISLLCRSNIELGDVTPHNLKQLRKLNQVVFPVIYNDKFYRDVLEAGELAKLGMLLNLGHLKSPDTSKNK